jgi:uncharacterized protein (TIGR02246 family)
MIFSMHFTRVLTVAVTLVVAQSPAHAQDIQANDEAAIKQLGVGWETAWNRRDAKALAALLAEDVDFVTVLGPNGWLKGRPRFEQVHASMFHTYFDESVWKTKEVYVKFIRPDLAIARVLWSTTGDKVRHIKHGAPREGIFSWVVEKRAGQWVILASQNTEAMPVLPGQ